MPVRLPLYNIDIYATQYKSHSVILLDAHKIMYRFRDGNRSLFFIQISVPLHAANVIWRSIAACWFSGQITNVTVSTAGKSGNCTIHYREKAVKTVVTNDNETRFF